MRERLGIVAADLHLFRLVRNTQSGLGLSAAVTSCPLPGWVSVIATDPKDSLATGAAGAPLRWICRRIAGTGLAHRIAGLIRSLADLGSCLITVLPRGDRIQAGADTYRLH